MLNSGIHTTHKYQFYDRVGIICGYYWYVVYALKHWSGLPLEPTLFWWITAEAGAHSSFRLGVVSRTHGIPRLFLGYGVELKNIFESPAEVYIDPYDNETIISSRLCITPTQSLHSDDLGLRWKLFIKRYKLLINYKILKLSNITYFIATVLQLLILEVTRKKFIHNLDIIFPLRVSCASAKALSTLKWWCGFGN